MAIATLTETICYHCGETCEANPIIWEDKEFCCHGCRTVFDILQENNLTCYYDLESNPGNNIKAIDKFKFEFLDSEEVEEKLLDFSSNSLKKVTLLIPSIHCSSCIWLLEHLNKIEAGIISSKIDFSQKKLSVDFNPKNYTLRQLVELLSKLGYEPLINLSTVEKQTTHLEKNLYLKMGIAGFCFGNIMLFSFPDYLGMTVEEELKSYFSYLSLILSLPVLIFSAQDYFKSSYRGIRKKYMNIDVPIALGIVVLFLRSSYEVIMSVGSGYFDSLSGLIFFLLIGKWIQSKTYQGLSFDRDYKSYFPLAVLKIESDGQTSTPVYKLNIGDKIKIRNSEIIPADSVLTSEPSQIDYSFVTGEATPIRVQTGEKIFAGGRLVGTVSEFVLTKKVSQSYLTKLWNNVDDQETKEKQPQSLIDSISAYFTIAILTIALGSFVYWAFVDISQAFVVFTSVLIVACPCALALATPFTLGTAMNILGRNKLYLKSTETIEQLWKISRIIFDKTGTITNNDQKESEYYGTPLLHAEKVAIKSVTANSVHPYSQLIYEHMNGTPAALQNVQNFQELTNQGVTGRVDNQLVKLGSLDFISKNLKGQITSDARHNIASVQLSINNELKGHFTFTSSYRKGLKDLISRLKTKFNLSILSGDSELEKSSLERLFPHQTDIFFRQKPEDKSNYIKSRQAENETVMMLGDGLNDAIALRQSDVGIAVTDNMASFSPASDAILSGEKISKLDAFLKFATDSKKIIIASFTISFLYNFIGLSFAISANLTPLLAAIVMPLSSISVVVFSTTAVKLASKKLNLL